MYALDAVIAQGIPTLITPFLTAVFISLTHLGDWHVIISFTLIVSGYYMLTHRPTYVYLLATLMLACIVVLGLKFAIGRPRPDIAQLILVGSADTSFPSWHAALSLTFYGYLAYLYISASVRTHRRLLVISLTTILIWIVGFSRIYLGVHWLSDIVAGWLIGLCVLVPMITFSQKKLYNTKA